MHKRINFGAALISILFLASLSCPQTAPAQYSKLAPCNISGFSGKAFCGSLDVPEDREKPEGKQVSLKIVVLAARNGAPEPDPLFLFAGGPGQASTDNAAGNAKRFAALTESRDLVMVDQRGTGGSNRLNCDLGGLIGVVNAFVAGKFDTGRVEACRNSLSKEANLARYSSGDAADDIDAVRRWLGYGKINIYGGSYGTREAQVYLRRHGDSVRTAILRGVYSIDPRYFGRDTEAALEKVFADCEASPKCKNDYPELRKMFESVLSKLDISPARFTLGTPSRDELLIDRDMFLGGIRRLLYDSNTQRSIPLFIAKASAGNYQPFDAIAREASGLLGSFGIGMFLSVACPEGILPGTDDSVPAATKYFGSYMLESTRAACRAWGIKRQPDAYFEPVRSEVPVLVLSGELDPVTPPSWGESAASTLENSVHLTMKGIAHSPFPFCASEIATRFIDSGTGKDLDTSCLARLARPDFLAVPKIEAPETIPAHGEEAQIANAELQWLKLAAMADRERLEAVLTDDFTQTEYEDGRQPQMQDKQRWIAGVTRLMSALENGKFQMASPEITVDGQEATVRTTWSAKGSLNGRSFESTIKVTDSWKKISGVWRTSSRKID